jgi:hypothetical protein
MITTSDFKPSPLAAIDLGKHNCRMSVASINKKSFSIVDSFSRVTRLGEGVSSHVIGQGITITTGIRIITDKKKSQRYQYLCSFIVKRNASCSYQMI